MIDGVCGGVAEYFELDPSLVRIAWVLLTLLGGSGIILYIVAMILIPTSPVIAPEGAAVPSASNHRFWGFLLVVVGTLWLLGNLGVWHRWWGFSWEMLLPTLLILAGVTFLFGGRRYVSNMQAQTAEGGTGAANPMTGPAGARSGRLYRSRVERKLFGVCGGLGVYFGIDPTWIRILCVVSAFASLGLTILAYILMAVVVADEPILFTQPEAGT
jgi:phage shock protein C